MYKKLKILFLVAGLVSVMSCEEELKPNPYTYTKFFTGEKSKTWGVKFFEETLDGKVIDNFLPSCLTDDRFKFYANTEHLYQTTSGSRQCFDDEAALSTSSWSFSNANASLIMLMPIFSEDPISFFVRSADNDDMVTEVFLDEQNSSSYRIHFSVIDEE